MIKSMTGFGRSEICEESRKITAEIKSVNHRYLDISIRMPKRFNVFEPAIRNLLKQYMQRGKVDVYIALEDLAESHYTLRYHPDLAGQYIDCFKEMAQEYAIENDITTSRLSRYPEVFTMEEQNLDEKEILSLIEQAIAAAAGQFSETRLKEGGNLKKDLLEKLDQMTEYVDYIDQRSGEVVSEYQKRIEEKVQDLLKNSGIDQNRILAEVMIYADKTCVDEELVRLKSHMKATRQTLESGVPVGRKLDFIVQEMNREANTILSKSNDILVSEQGINLKTVIEKIREQIQNIE